jgi:hypothetical protein
MFGDDWRYCTLSAASLQKSRILDGKLFVCNDLRLRTRMPKGLAMVLLMLPKVNAIDLGQMP